MDTIKFTFVWSLEWDLFNLNSWIPELNKEASSLQYIL